MTKTEDRAPRVAPQGGARTPRSFKPPADAYVADQKLLGTIANLQRIRDERRAAGVRVREAEDGLRLASTRDREASAAAIRAGTQPPGDEYAVTAVAELNEARKHLDAASLALAAETKLFEQQVAGARDAELAALEPRIDAAMSKAAKDLARLRASLEELDNLRAAFVFFHRWPGSHGVSSHARPELDAIAGVIAKPAVQPPDDANAQPITRPFPAAPSVGNPRDPG